MASRIGMVGWALSIVVAGFAATTSSGCSGDGPSGAGGGNAGGAGGTGGEGVSSSSSSGSSGAGGMGSGGGGQGGNASSSSSGNASSSSSSSSSGSSSDPCMGASDGNHCGTELGGLADHNSLYTCNGGATSKTTPCNLGCENNACKMQMQTDPCASAMSGNGAYCGGSLAGGDPNALYNCQNGVTANKQNCANGCQVNPPGTPDSCKPTGGGTCCVAKPPGILTQSYSACGGGGSHYGIDLGTPVGTPIYAPMAGTVVGSALGFPNCYNNGCSSSCWNSFNYVKVKSDCGDPGNGNNDLFVYYLHIDSMAAGIANGSHVEQGQLLAYSGNSGCSSGPHIHIETVSVAKGQNASLSTCNSVNPASRYCP